MQATADIGARAVQAGRVRRAICGASYLWLAAALTIVTSCRASTAQPSPGGVPKIPRIVYLAPRAPGEFSPFSVAFMQGLRDLGYVEGENVTVEFKEAGGQEDRFAELVAEALQMPPDVIVASSSPAVAAAKNATSSIPIVMVGVGDALGTGLVASLSRPGANVTGVTSFSPELSAKRLELFKEAIPSLSRVAVLWNPRNPVKLIDWEETERAAGLLGVSLESLAVRSPDEFGAAFESAVATGCDGLVVLGDPMTVQNAPRIIELATRSRFPGIYEGREFAEAGGLLSYAANRVDY